MGHCSVVVAHYMGNYEGKADSPVLMTGPPSIGASVREFGLAQRAGEHVSVCLWGREATTTVLLKPGVNKRARLRLFW